jgi:hypothetical protein
MGAIEMKYKDLTNKRFGKLRAIQPINEHLESGQHKRWLCLCDCGKSCIVSSSHLVTMQTQSCGCKAHGLSNTRLFRIWIHIKNRCNNPKDENYKHYGARNIKVCTEWEQDFKTFYDWANTNGYTDKLSIDRIDNNKGYSPDNCRWVTAKIQANNTRWNHIVELNGISHTISEWADIKGIKANTLLYRLRRGWSVERALNEEVKR